MNLSSLQVAYCEVETYRGIDKATTFQEHYSTRQIQNVNFLRNSIP